MKFLNALIILFLPILLTACEKKHQESTLIVGTSADNPPYEFIQNGEIVGIDIDIINEIGKRLNKKVIIRNLDFNGLLPALATQNVDVVIAALSITPERQKYLNFSKHYGRARVAILYRDNEQIDIKDIKDLDNKVVGSQLGSSWEAILQNSTKNMNITIHSLSNNLMLVEELKAKVIDAVILEEWQCIKFKENNPNLKSCSLEEFSSEFAIAIPKNSVIVEEINDAIASMRNDGTINKITKKWLIQ